MSEPLRVSYVVEGKTDFIVLDALVEYLLDGKDYATNRIQPPISDYAGDQGVLGGGWKGVIKWCENQGGESRIVGGFANSLVLRNCDCLIIHVDADIAEETELSHLNLGLADTPTRTCENIRNHIASLLGGNPLPKQIVICVPAQCTEAWVFVALHTARVAQFYPIECRRDVDELLMQQPERLVRKKDGAVKKESARYRTVTKRIIANWAAVVANCDQARVFESSFRAVLP